MGRNTEEEKEEQDKEEEEDKEDKERMGWNDCRDGWTGLRLTFEEMSN